MSASVTEEQRAYHLRKMRTRFARMDLNKDGFISREDYELMGKRLAEQGGLTKKQAESVHEKLMVIADTILKLKPGEKIPIQEAIETCSNTQLSRSSMYTPDERKAAMKDGIHAVLFDIIDLNKDGHISPEELKVYFKVIAPDVNEADVVKTFKTIDTNRNGEISLEEFLCASEDFFFGVEETEISKVFMGPLLD